MHTVETCKIMTASPFCISIDNKSVLRVWDIRTFTTSQVITLDSFEIPYPFLCLLSDDNLVLFSRKIFRLSNQNSIERKNILSSVAPLHIAFNEYHKKFIMATTLDVRLYCSETGRLEEIFVDLVEQGSTIKCFEEGARKRMFYIGDSSGHVRLFNTKNGEKLKTVTDQEKDSQVISRFMRIMKMKEDNSPFKDVTALKYLPDEKILVVGTINSHIKLYNEIDSEESQFSRIFLGGHQESEITVFAYCRETEQLASGSDNGIVCVWNLGTGKLDNIFFDVQSRVTYVAFCHPFPFLIVVQKAGIVTLWGLKQSGAELHGKCILTLFNFDEATELLEFIESGLLVKHHTALYRKTYLMDAPIGCSKKDIDTCKKLKMELRKDIESVEIVNQFVPEELEQLTSVIRLESSSMRSIETDDHSSTDGKECMCLLLGTSQGRLLVLDLIGFLKSKTIQRLTHAGKQNQSSQQGKAEKDKKERFESIAANSQVLNYLASQPRRQRYINVYLLHRSLVIQEHGLMTGEESLPLKMIQPIATSNHSLLVSSTNSCISVLDKTFSHLGSIDLLGGESSKGWGFRFDWQADRVTRVNGVIRVENEIEGMPWSETLVKIKTKQQVKEIEKCNAANVGLAIVTTAYCIKKEFERLSRERTVIGAEGMIINKKAYWEYQIDPEELRKAKDMKVRKTMMDKSLYELVNKNVAKMDMRQQQQQLRSPKRSQGQSFMTNIKDKTLTKNDSGSPKAINKVLQNRFKIKMPPMINFDPDSEMVKSLSARFRLVDDPQGKYKPPQKTLFSLEKKMVTMASTSNFRLNSHRGKLLDGSRSMTKMNNTQIQMTEDSPKVNQTLEDLDSRIVKTISKAKQRIRQSAIS